MTTEHEHLIAIWADTARTATTNRNAAIVAAREDGLTLARIATAAGLTPPAISLICEREAVKS